MCVCVCVYIYISIQEHKKNCTKVMQRYGIIKQKINNKQTINNKQLTPNYISVKEKNTQIYVKVCILLVLIT